MNPTVLNDVAEGGVNVMTELLTTIGSVFTSAVGWVGTVAETITGEPLLLIGCVLGFIGVGVGLFKRMFNI